MLGLEDTLLRDHCFLECHLMVIVGYGSSKRILNQKLHQMNSRNESIVMGVEQNFHRDCVNCVPQQC